MKTLLVFYSRTGTTKKLAEEISKNLKCDLEEIFDTKNRLGIIGYLKSGHDAMLKKFTKIEKTKKNPAKYDLVIIGTPIWVYNLCTPIRTYLYENRDNLKKVAFFCTMGGSGAEKTFSDIENICNKKPIATLQLKTKKVISNNFEKLKEFINLISKK
ncbi:MAG: flavodoxin [Candidatus Woesearchaeota archaeon]